MGKKTASRKTVHRYLAMYDETIVASGDNFEAFRSDLTDYLVEDHGFCDEDEIDFISVIDTHNGKEYSAKGRVVNEIILTEIE